MRETLQQDKELTIQNTSIGIIGPAGAHEKSVPPGGSFRILEEENVEPYIENLPARDGVVPPTAPAAAGAAGATAPPPGDEDVQMAE